MPEAKRRDAQLASNLSLEGFEQIFDLQASSLEANAPTPAEIAINSLVRLYAQATQTISELTAQIKTLEHENNKVNHSFSEIANSKTWKIVSQLRHYFVRPFS